MPTFFPYLTSKAKIDKPKTKRTILLISYMAFVHLLLVFLFTDIYIHVTNVNEFSPEFSQTSYTIYVQPNTLVGTSVLSVSADDLDANLDTDSEFYYTLDQSTLPGGTEYFHIDQKGRIYLVEDLTTFSGVALNFTTIVTNPGTPVKSGTAIVEVIIPSGTTTTTTSATTDRDKGKQLSFLNMKICSFKSSENILKRG